MILGVTWANPLILWLEEPCAQKGQRGGARMTHSSPKPQPHTDQDFLDWMLQESK